MSPNVKTTENNNKIPRRSRDNHVIMVDLSAEEANREESVISFY